MTYARLSGFTSERDILLALPGNGLPIGVQTDNLHLRIED